MSESENKSQVAHSGAQGDSSPAESSSGTGLSRLFTGKSAAETEPAERQGKTSNLMMLWKATENEGSVLKRLIKIISTNPKLEQESSETSAAPLDKVSLSTSMETLPAVSVVPTPSVERAPERHESPILPSTILPATQSQCDPSYLEQPDSTFLAHMQGPSPMIVVPDSPYIHRRMSRSEKAAQLSKPEPEWRGMGLDDSTQTSQNRVLENIPSPDELRQLTTGKHKTVEEPSQPSVPVNSKVSRMTPERTSSERAKIFFVELAANIKKLFAPRL